ncbi:hypothetical protein [Paenibacillus terrae]|uniref:Uncharacterized protein n=1 Tax=Paenibacillus terrae TaxID=159743 RepID=A0A0D7WZ40_9BACL|nr:hypothetical protein [Paenibacillus terrae]KJD43022.1 hypothetical protein QD47_24990 [Paenibacillus terrae]
MLTKGPLEIEKTKIIIQVLLAAFNRGYFRSHKHLFKYADLILESARRDAYLNRELYLPRLLKFLEQALICGMFSPHDEDSEMEAGEKKVASSLISGLLESKHLKGIIITNDEVTFYDQFGIIDFWNIEDVKHNPDVCFYIASSIQLYWAEGPSALREMIERTHANKTQKHEKLVIKEPIQELIFPCVSDGINFNVRIVKKGELNNAGIHVETDIIEFYDSRYNFTKYGQFVASYSIETFRGYSLKFRMNRFDVFTLNTAIKAWTISSNTMYLIHEWLDQLGYPAND